MRRDVRFYEEKAMRISLERELSIPLEEEILVPKEEPQSDPQSQILLKARGYSKEDDLEKPHVEE